MELFSIRLLLIFGAIFKIPENTLSHSRKSIAVFSLIVYNIYKYVEYTLL